MVRSKPIVHRPPVPPTMTSVPWRQSAAESGDRTIAGHVDNNVVSPAARGGILARVVEDVVRPKFANHA